MLTADDVALGERARFREGGGEITTATPRRDMHPLVLAGLGLDPAEPVSRAEINCLLSGHRSDGGRIEGKTYAKHREFVDQTTGERRESTPIGSYDFCPTPDKSVSIAWAFAPSVEQAVIHTAHMEAAREAIAYITTEIGQARKGAGGEDGREPGHVGWIEFDHYTARRTVGIASNGGTEFVAVPTEVPGDPDIHTHFTIVNAVFCESGRVGLLRIPTGSRASCSRPTPTITQSSDSDCGMPALMSRSTPRPARLGCRRSPMRSGRTSLKERTTARLRRASDHRPRRPLHLIDALRSIARAVQRSCLGPSESEMARADANRPLMTA